jgi:hypothetical protein
MSVGICRSDAKLNTSFGASIRGGGEATRTSAVAQPSRNKVPTHAAPAKTPFMS